MWHGAATILLAEADGDGRMDEDKMIKSDA